MKGVSKEKQKETQIALRGKMNKYEKQHVTLQGYAKPEEEHMTEIENCWPAQSTSLRSHRMTGLGTKKTRPEKSVDASCPGAWKRTGNKRPSVLHEAMLPLHR